jgi:hypothetical protein
VSARRAALYGVAALLCLAAALAVSILLFGSFGETQGRILLTTLLAAFEGVLALAPLTLLGQGRARPLAYTSLALSSTMVAITIAFVWGASLDGTPGKLLATIASVAAAAMQATITTARSGHADGRTVERLRGASHALALALATGASVSAWAEISSTGWYRILGAVLVVDVLAVGLQPVLARSADPGTSARFRVTLVAAGGERSVEVEARDAVEAIVRAAGSDRDRAAMVGIRGERLP